MDDHYTKTLQKDFATFSGTIYVILGGCCGCAMMVAFVILLPLIFTFCLRFYQ